MEIDKGFEPLSDLFNAKAVKTAIKPPAHEWQDLALRVIKELNIPSNKRNSVFKICKDNTKIFVEQCMNDTKELCRSGEQWRYFFKVADKK